MSQTATQDPALFGGPVPTEPKRATRNAKGVAATVPDEFIDPETGEPYRRRSMRDSTINTFELNPKTIRPGWDYQWEPFKVLNEPVDNDVYIRMREGAWTPVTPSEAPLEVPPGWTGSTVERLGQRLYKRPKYLSEQASVELRQAADEQLRSKYESIQATPPGHAPRVVDGVNAKVEALPGDLRRQYGYQGSHDLAEEV